MLQLWTKQVMFIFGAAIHTANVVKIPTNLLKSLCLLNSFMIAELNIQLFKLLVEEIIH